MTEPVADLKHLSSRLPEDETGGDPQTGEGAIRLDDRAGDRVAGDPALTYVLTASESGEPETVVTEPDPVATVPLIPADNQPDVPAPSTKE